MVVYSLLFSVCSKMSSVYITLIYFIYLFCQILTLNEMPFGKKPILSYKATVKVLAWYLRFVLNTG